MNVDFINPFITSAIRVFAEMLNVKITRGRVSLSPTQPAHHISGLISLTGNASGMVVLSFDRAAAIFATGALLGAKPGSITPEVIDAVGELTNIVAGCAKAQLEELNMSLSLPTVIAGRNHLIAFPRQIQPITIPFDCPVGRISLQVGLREEKASGLFAGQARAAQS
jgi:chemotaxis protein CheX